MNSWNSSIRHFLKKGREAVMALVVESYVNGLPQSLFVVVFFATESRPRWDTANAEMKNPGLVGAQRYNKGPPFL